MAKSRTTKSQVVSAKKTAAKAKDTMVGKRRTTVRTVNAPKAW